jgi:hypothetical protein
MSCVVITWVHGAVGQERDEHDLEPVPKYTEVHNAYGTVKTFFLVHNICERDKKNSSESGIGSFI